VPTFSLVIEYDGSRFQGWQIQARGRTVQGVLLDALRKALEEPGVDVQGAGRTDAGVHALGQVASVRCRRRIEADELHRRLEELLPQDLALVQTAAAPPAFHARHHAEARVYRYQITRRRSAFGKRYSWWVDGELDVPAMAAAGEALVGRHDFGAFAKRTGEGGSTLVEMESVEVAQAGAVVLLRFVASHFLWNQVRRMVAALVEVGRGKAAADVTGWLTGAVEPPAGSAPAAGLFLEAVRYPGNVGELAPLAPVGIPVEPEGRFGVPSFIKQPPRQSGRGRRAQVRRA